MDSKNIGSSNNSNTNIYSNYYQQPFKYSNFSSYLLSNFDNSSLELSSSMNNINKNIEKSWKSRSLIIKNSMEIDYISESYTIDSETPSLNLYNGTFYKSYLGIATSMYYKLQSVKFESLVKNENSTILKFVQENGMNYLPKEFDKNYEIYDLKFEAGFEDSLLLANIVIFVFTVVNIFLAFLTFYSIFKVRSFFSNIFLSLKSLKSRELSVRVEEL